MEEERKVPSMFSGAMRVAATSATLYSDSKDMFTERERDIYMYIRGKVKMGVPKEKAKREMECYIVPGQKVQSLAVSRRSNSYRVMK
jgi:hypothetical protein